MVGVRVISGFDLVKSMAVSTEDLSDKSSALGNCIEEAAAAAAAAAAACTAAAEFCDEKLSTFVTGALPLESCRLRSRAASSRLTAASSFTLEAVDVEVATAVSPAPPPPRALRLLPP